MYQTWDTTFSQIPLDPKNDSIMGCDFILPGKSVEFQYGFPMVGYRSMAFTMKLYLSFYDVDDNEYLEVTQIVPGADINDIDLTGQKPLFDSLESLKKENLYEYKTYENLGLRKPGTFLGGDDKWIDSSNSISK